MLRTAILAGTALAMTATDASAQDDAAFARAVEAVQSRMAPIDAQEGRIPGRALVFVQAGEEPVIDVRGVRNVDSGAPADADTPFYIASMTKAFVGLMAVRLDAMGIMPLDMTLAEAYPDMQLDGVDLTAITMEDALSHRLGFHVPAITFRTAYTDATPPADFAAIANAGHEMVDAEFSYSNLGYVLYAGALEQRTGRSWKAWLDELVFHPLGMRHSSARTSDLPEASFTHEAYDDGWRSYAPKTDEIMHAAGGMFVSAADMARWLEASAGGSSEIGAELFDAAQAPRAAADRSQGPVSCSDYALGWAVCEAAGIRFLEHGGTYTGARSEMIVLPDHGVGFAAMFNSDSMTGGLGFQLLTMFVMAYAGETDSLPPPDAFAERYAQMADRYRTSRSGEEEQILPGDWQPVTAALARYGGNYSHPQLGELRLSGVGTSTLQGELNGMPLVLVPLAENHFAARVVTQGGGSDFRPQFGEDGRVVAIEWAGDIFTRN